MSKHRYEHTKGGSKKFWEVEVDGSSYTVVYGRIGTEGRAQTKTAADASAAEMAVAKLIRQKTGKG
jgi:predicted DNA-binding WGR domain protein